MYSNSRMVGCGYLLLQLPLIFLDLYYFFIFYVHLYGFIFHNKTFLFTFIFFLLKITVWLRWLLLLLAFLKTKDQILHHATDKSSLILCKPCFLEKKVNQSQPKQWLLLLRLIQPLGSISAEQVHHSISNCNRLKNMMILWR